MALCKLHQPSQLSSYVLLWRRKARTSSLVQPPWHKYLHQGKGRDALKGKRFLLVLDNVWSEDRKDYLKLFAQIVFSDDQDREAYPDLQEIGKKIVNKCKGNPLAVISVGGILCGVRHPEKWEKILESSMWELLQEDSKDIIPSLWLSYINLPSQIKPCFAYCSIFPKDYQFKKEVVVQLWMA
ncbi:hypothetical protein UlMin_039548 [Ulmus minor]